MSNELATKPKDEAAQIMERVLMAGDLQKLKPEDRIRYYHAVCESVGLNPLTTPFEYINLNGKLVLYAKKSCTDQLRSIHGVSIVIADRKRDGDIYVVSARATNSAGRVDEDVGAVSINNSKGDALCNALMKAETKAKRRVTLSICGLGMLDETEVASVPGGQVLSIEQMHSPAASPEEQPASPSDESQIDPEAKPPATPAAKGNAYAETFISLLDQVTAPKGAEASGIIRRAMASLLKQHKMDSDTVTPEIGARLIQAIVDGKFDPKPPKENEAA